MSISAASRKPCISAAARNSRIRRLRRHGLAAIGLLAFWRSFNCFGSHELARGFSRNPGPDRRIGVGGRPGGAACAAARRATPPMVFYVVKGAPDACGRGCDSWIAVEGQVDAGAAPRFRKFLRRSGNRNLPFYLHSPGGNLDHALAMGAMLRERRAVAQGGADGGEGVRLRGAGRRGLPQAETIRPRTPRRSLDPRRDLQLGVPLSHAGRDHPRDPARRAAGGAFAEGGGAFPRQRRADRRDAGRGDANAARARRPHALQLHRQDGRRHRLARTRAHHQVRRACTC